MIASSTSIPIVSSYFKIPYIQTISATSSSVLALLDSNINKSPYSLLSELSTFILHQTWHLLNHSTNLSVSFQDYSFFALPFFPTLSFDFLWQDLCKRVRKHHISSFPSQVIILSLYMYVHLCVCVCVCVCVRACVWFSRLFSHTEI